MKRKSIAFIIIAAMLLTMASFSLTFADTAAPGKAVIKSAKAKMASKKTGKANVTIKWKKQKGISSYQIYLKRLDGDWKCVKTVGGKKTSAKIKAYVGKNYVQVRAIKKVGDQSLAGPFSNAKTFKVKAKMTLQKYLKKHGSQRKALEKAATDNGTALQIRDNDLIYIYDLAKNIDASAITPALVAELDQELTRQSSTFINAAKALNRGCGIGGCRVITKYVHNGNPVLVREFY